MRAPTPNETAEISAWFSTLSPAERREIGRSSATPRRAPTRVLARFVERDVLDEEAGEVDAAHAGKDIYEHVVRYGLTIADGIPNRTFHICSAHPDARAVIHAGRIPTSFRCPLAETACPMRALLDQQPGCDVVLGR